MVKGCMDMCDNKESENLRVIDGTATQTIFSENRKLQQLCGELFCKLNYLSAVMEKQQSFSSQINQARKAVADIAIIANVMSELSSEALVGLTVREVMNRNAIHMVAEVMCLDEIEGKELSFEDFRQIVCDKMDSIYSDRQKAESRKKKGKGSRKKKKSWKKKNRKKVKGEC